MIKEDKIYIINMTHFHTWKIKDTNLKYIILLMYYILFCFMFFLNNTISI